MVTQDFGRIWRRGLLLGAAATAGCTGLEGLRPRETRSGYRFDATRGDAVVLGSMEVLGVNPGSQIFERWITAIGRIDTTETDRIHNNQGQASNARVIPGAGMLFDFNGTEPSGTSYVSLFVLAVPPGRYGLASLNVQRDRLSVTTTLPTLSFTLNGNEFRYIGNLFFRYDGDLRVQEIAARNRAERDLPRLAEAAPWVPRDRIRVDIATSPGWHNERAA